MYNVYTVSVTNQGVEKVKETVCELNFKWPSRQRWQCPICNGTLETLICFKKLKDAIVFWL